LSLGPGWNENDYFKTLGKLADGPMSFIPWCDPTKKLTKQLMGSLAKSYPDINMYEKHFYTFEALLVRRARRSADRQH
jgi:branched-chain amino acid transport system substrate-binding protein